MKNNEITYNNYINELYESHGDELENLMKFFIDVEQDNPTLLFFYFINNKGNIPSVLNVLKSNNFTKEFTNKIKFYCDRIINKTFIF